MSTESIVKPGVYRIAVWRGAEGAGAQFLSITADNAISVLPAKSQIAISQEWSVLPGPDGTVKVEIPAHVLPLSSLSYEKPEEGERIILGPPRFWSIEVAPEKPFPVPFIIRVPGKDLIMIVSLLTIFPPQLRLEAAPLTLENAWAFIPVNHD